MTKKDFELIAQTIKNLDLWYIHDGHPHDAKRSYIARQFAIALQHTDARFDVDKFVESCQE